MLTANEVGLITSVLAFIASIIAVIATAYNSRFGRYTSERWWERKVEAYVRIIDAFSDLVYYYQQIYDAELEARELTETRKAEIEDLWRKGIHLIKKASNMGAFLISTEAENALRCYWDEPKEKIDPNDWFGHLTYEYDNAEKTLNQLVICAKKDLQVEKIRSKK
jgi:hypothetical protein